jgi:hypothetical protein
VSHDAASAARAQELRRASQQAAIKILAKPPMDALPGWLEVARERAKDDTSKWPDIAERMGLPLETVMGRWERVRRAAGLLKRREPRPGAPRVARPSGLFASCEGYSPSAGVADWRAAS